MTTSTTARRKPTDPQRDPRVLRADVELVDWDQRAYRVWSATDPTVSYQVKRLGGEWVCQCTGYTNHGHCWHGVAAGARYLRDLREQTARLRQDVARWGREWSALLPSPARRESALLEMSQDEGEMVYGYAPGVV